MQLLRGRRESALRSQAQEGGRQINSFGFLEPACYIEAQSGQHVLWTFTG